MDFDLSNWLSQFNIFGDVNFSILYNWLPADISAVIGFCISFLCILAVIGIIKRFLLR